MAAACTPCRRYGRRPAKGSTLPPCCSRTGATRSCAASSPMSAPAIPAARRSTCSISVTPTSTGSGSHARWVCLGQRLRRWRRSTTALPRGSPPPARSSSRSCSRRHGVAASAGAEPEPVLHRFQLVAVDRQLAQALAGRRKDRVGDCGNDGRSPGFAHSAGRLGIIDNVNLDDRRLVYAQDLVGIEIGLLYTAVL